MSLSKTLIPLRCFGNCKTYWACMWWETNNKNIFLPQQSFTGCASLHTDVWAAHKFAAVGFLKKITLAPAYSGVLSPWSECYSVAPWKNILFFLANWRYIKKLLLFESMIVRRLYLLHYICAVMLHFQTFCVENSYLKAWYNTKNLTTPTVGHRNFNNHILQSP